MRYKIGKGLKNLKRKIYFFISALLLLTSCQKKPVHVAGEVYESLNAHGLYRTDFSPAKVKQKAPLRSELRAYHGAPPRIPHQVGEATAEASCLNCHHVGAGHGPNVLHELQSNCRQCHVPILTEKEFVQNGPLSERTLSRLPGAWPLSPPYIPHRLQDRQNCSVCHTSVGARADLVPQHGDLPNCRQCHLQLQLKAAPFSRKM